MHRILLLSLLLLLCTMMLIPSGQASGFLFLPGSWPYGHRDGLDSLDDNPAAGFNESGAGGTFGAESFIPAGSTWYSNRSRYEWGVPPWPRYYAGEPDALKVRRRDRVYYPLSARGRVTISDWAISAGVRVEGGRLTKFSKHYYFDNISTLNYDRLHLQMREALQFTRFRIAGSHSLGPAWRVGIAALMYTGRFEGLYLKEYDYLGIWPDFRDYRLKVAEEMTGTGAGAQAGIQWGQEEDEIRLGAWISSGCVFHLNGTGSWEKDDESTRYSQRIRIALPPRAEITARFPLPWIGWGVHVGTHIAWWRTDPFRRKVKALDIPEPSWRPSIDWLLGASFQPPNGWELGAGYRFLHSAGNDRNWPNSFTDKDLHRFDLQGGYTYEGLTLRVYGGLAFDIDRAITDPAQMEVGSTIAFAIE